MSHAATITSKGQITIPRAARKVLNTNTVEVEIQGDTVVLRPVKSVAGVLAGYGRVKEPFSTVRDKVWKEVADEKAGNAA
jgi:AbrB family looped-hinge helix DNA binding protein